MDQDGWRENRPGAAPFRHALVQLWGSRELVGFFALRDLKVRYKQAVLGAAWVLLQPLTTVAALTLVFNRLANVASQGVPYPLFALIGLLTWTYVSRSVTDCSEVLVANSALVTKVWFPRLAAPVAAVLPPLLDLAVAAGLVAVLLAVYGIWPGWQLLVAPLSLLLAVCAALGAGLALATLNVRFRDTRQAIAPLLQLGLFLSPVAYASSSLHGAARLAYAINPAAGAIDLARWSVAGAPWPGWSLAISATSALLVLAGGLLIFLRAERSFADVI